MAKQKKMWFFYFFFFNMDVVILLSVVLNNMCGSHANLIVYCWRTERQYVTICPCVPSNRQPTSCDLSSVVTLNFNKLSGGIREILYYRVWSLVKRIFWEGIISCHWKYVHCVYTHTRVQYIVIIYYTLYCAAYSSRSILSLAVHLFYIIIIRYKYISFLCHFFLKSDNIMAWHKTYDR